MRLGESGMADNLSLSLDANEMALRASLKQVRDYLADCGFSESFLGNVEIVLAEAVNNVIEHAYAEMPDGRIDMRLERTDTGIVIFLEDEGVEMPGGVAPAGRSHDLDVDVDNLPEGGFGWFLIRTLTDRLEFSRIGKRNRLCMHMQANQGAS